MESYIMRNGGWVTPQLDNILEKAIFIDIVNKAIPTNFSIAHARPPRSDFFL